MKPKLLDLDGGTVLIDDADFDRLGGRSIYIGTNGYAYFSMNATGPQTIHSFVIGATTAGSHIDHINGDKLDNRRVNLRVVTPQINQVNRKQLSKSNRSGVRGVGLTSASRKNPWRAQIMVNRKAIHLGLFPTLDEALAARRDVELRYFGEECPR